LHHGCYGPEEIRDIEDARRVADDLGIPYRVIDLTREYQSVVLDYFQSGIFLRSLQSMRQMQPPIKFGILIDKAREMGLEFDFAASGHYARVEFNGDRYLLKKARPG
jgi:tRNA-specific 2-thiouridylase